MASSACASEFDDSVFYGLVVGFEPELGYFSLSELRERPRQARLAGRAGQVVQAHAAPRAHGRAQVRRISSLIINPMTYMQDLEQQLHDRLECGGSGFLDNGIS